MKNKREVTFEVIKDIYWDNWGHLSKVFNKGDICKGTQYPTGVVVAESPYYEGVSDMVDLEHINIITGSNRLAIKCTNTGYIYNINDIAEIEIRD